MQLRVVFTDDPTGMSKDITEIINIPSDVCLLCCHDKSSRLHAEIMKALEYKGYELRWAFTLWKVYTT